VITMKIRYCVSLLLLCAATIFSKSTTVKAEDKYYKFLEKYFTIEEKYKSKWGQQDGFTYLCEKKIIPSPLLEYLWIKRR
jgi:hypothetical protein